MRTDSIFTAGLVGLTVWAAGSTAPAQFQAPQNALQYEDTGTFEAMQENFIKIHDSKNDTWLLLSGDGTTVTVEGEAEHDCLRGGTFVEFTGQIDKKGVLQKEPEEILLLDLGGKPSVGIFAAETKEDSKPLRDPGAGTFRIKGRVVAYKDGQITLMAGRTKITGSIGEEVALKVYSDDIHKAQTGDEAKVKAWYYDNGKPISALNRPGRAVVEEITITLSKPLAYTGKKARPSTAKPTAKSSRASK